MNLIIGLNSNCTKIKAHIVSICSILGHKLTIHDSNRMKRPTASAAFACVQCSIWSIRLAGSSFRLLHFQLVIQMHPIQLDVRPENVSLICICIFFRVSEIFSINNLLYLLTFFPFNRKNLAIASLMV